MSNFEVEEASNGYILTHMPPRSMKGLEATIYNSREDLLISINMLLNEWEKKDGSDKDV